jgi:hypothetical protein
MKLSDKTLKVLKNFSVIEPNIVIQPGNEIRTRNEGKTIGARYRADETFNKEISLYSLQEFLSIYSIFKAEGGPDLELGDTSLTISDKYGKQKIAYSNKNTMTWADKIPPALDYNYQFSLSNELLSRLLSAISANGFEYIAFYSKGGKLSVIAGELHKETKDFDPSANLYTIDVDVETDQDFNIVVAASDLVMLVDNYEVGIFFNDQAKIIHFFNERIDYWISIQKFSRFES